MADVYVIFGVPITCKQTMALMTKYFPEKTSEMLSQRKKSLEKMEKEIIENELCPKDAERCRACTLDEIFDEEFDDGPFTDELFTGSGCQLPNGLHVCALEYFDAQQLQLFGYNDVVAVIGMFVGETFRTKSELPKLTMFHPSRYQSLMNNMSVSDRMTFQTSQEFRGSKDYYQKSLLDSKPVPSYADFAALLAKIKQYDSCQLLQEILPQEVEPQVFCLLSDRSRNY